MSDVALGVLDLVPIPSGSTAADALRNSIDLAQQAERFGYARYWFAEHHLNPGVAGTSPAVVLALTASATSTIRLGSGAVQLGHRTALSTVEEFGLLDALHPGRFDLGLGRSGGRPSGQPAAPLPTATPVVDGRTPNGLLIPPRFSFEHLLGSPRIALQRRLLLLPGAQSQDYAEQIDDILALLAGTYRSPEGVEAHVVPGEGADVKLWILGSSGGQSAEVAGARGCGSRRTTTSVRPRSWRRWRATGPSSSLPSSWTSRTSACRRTSSSPRTRQQPANSPPATARGCAASVPPRAP